MTFCRGNHGSPHARPLDALAAVTTHCRNMHRCPKALHKPFQSTVRELQSGRRIEWEGTFSLLENPLTPKPEAVSNAANIWQCILLTGFYTIEVTNKNELKILRNFEIYFHPPNLSLSYYLFQKCTTTSSRLDQHSRPHLGIGLALPFKQ